MGASSGIRQEFLYESYSAVNGLKLKIKKLEADIRMLMEVLKSIKRD